MVTIIPVTALDLVFQIIKSDPGTTGSVYMGFSPDVAGLVREINEGDGAPDYTMGARGVALENTLVEVGVRGNPEDYLTPRNECLRLRYLVSSKLDYTHNGLRLLWAKPSGFITYLGRDSQRRVQFAIRFECCTDPSQA